MIGGLFGNLLELSGANIVQHLEQRRRSGWLRAISQAASAGAASRLPAQHLFDRDATLMLVSLDLLS